LDREASLVQAQADAAVAQIVQVLSFCIVCYYNVRKNMQIVFACVRFSYGKIAAHGLFHAFKHLFDATMSTGVQPSSVATST